MRNNNFNFNQNFEKENYNPNSSRQNTLNGMSSHNKSIIPKKTVESNLTKQNIDILKMQKQIQNQEAEQQIIEQQEEFIHNLKKINQKQSDFIFELEEFEDTCMDKITSKTNKFSELQLKMDQALFYCEELAYPAHQSIYKSKKLLIQYETNQQKLKNKMQTLHEENIKMKQNTQISQHYLDALTNQNKTLDFQLQQLSNSSDQDYQQIQQVEKQIKTLNQQTTDIHSSFQNYVEQKKKLNNELQEIKGNIRVYCRIKPIIQTTQEEQQEQNQESNLLEIIKENQIILRVPADIIKSKNDVQSYQYSFEHIYPQNADQDMVYNELSQLIQSSIDGYNVCIFCYGQTGSGKTYTMVGDLKEQRQYQEQMQIWEQFNLENSQYSNEKPIDNRGIVFRAVDMIFKQLKELEKIGWKYKLTASFTEVYNEQVRCLITKKQEEIEVFQVNSQTDVFKLVNQAAESRVVHSTSVNEHSSRSHCLIQFKITGENSNKNNTIGASVSGSLNLIDLAGSERLSQSNAEGDRLKETQAINKSLTSLSDVIYALAMKSPHIPYRNSKLTKLLQEYLGGNSKTLMLVNISSQNKDFHQTLCSLRFAEKVQSCKSNGKISKNKNGNDSVGTPSKNIQFGSNSLITNNINNYLEQYNNNLKAQRKIYNPNNNNATITNIQQNSNSLNNLLINNNSNSLNFNNKLILNNLIKETTNIVSDEEKQIKENQMVEENNNNENSISNCKINISETLQKFNNNVFISNDQTNNQKQIIEEKQDNKINQENIVNESIPKDFNIEINQNFDDLKEQNNKLIPEQNNIDIQINNQIDNENANINMDINNNTDIQIINDQNDIQYISNMNNIN